MDSRQLLPPETNTSLSSSPFVAVQPSLPGGIPAAFSQEVTLWEYLRVLHKRKWIVIASVVICTTIAAIASFRATPRYEAMGRIAIFREGGDILGFNEPAANTTEDWDYTIALETQVKILQSDAIAMQVIRDLRLDQNPDFGPVPPAQSLPADGSLAAPAQMDPQRSAKLLETFRRSLKASAVPRTRLIEIRFDNPDPALAARVVNALVSTYIEQNFRTKFESTMHTSEWLAKQLTDLQLKVETAQEKLVRYQKEHNILGVDEKQNITTARLDELNRQMTLAQTERIQKEATYQLASSEDPDLLSKVDPSSLMEKLRTQKAELESKYAQATTQFGPSYPKVVELTSQLKQIDASIQAEVRRISGRLKGEYLAAMQREKMLRAAFEAQKTEANQLNENAIQYNILKRDAETSRQLYEGLLQKLKEAGVSAGLRSSNIRVVDKAQVPAKPSSPEIPKNLALSLLAGLLGGVALAFVVEALDNTVRTPEQAQQVVLLPSLGIIPDRAEVDGRRARGRQQLALETDGNSSVALLSHSLPNSEIAEAFRALRTSILLSTLGGPPKVLLITSALPQEGKTTISVNTAVVLAQRGSRVLLVDADLRRPGVSRVFGIKSCTGLSMLLTGSDGKEPAIVPAPGIPNLFVLPAGPTPPHPSELLGSGLMKELIAQWRTQYDHIVFDTPPIISVTDAVLLSAEADAVVLVIRSSQTTREALRRARNLLMQVNARVLGLVVNAVNLQSPDLYYYYYGSKYRRYYDDRTKQE